MIPESLSASQIETIITLKTNKKNTSYPHLQKTFKNPDLLRLIQLGIALMRQAEQVFASAANAEI